MTRRNADKLKDLVSEIKDQGGIVHAFGSDARREEQVISLISEIENEIGPIQIAVYNVCLLYTSDAADE